VVQGECHEYEYEYKYKYNTPHLTHSICLWSDPVGVRRRRAKDLRRRAPLPTKFSELPSYAFITDIPCHGIKKARCLSKKGAQMSQRAGRPVLPLQCGEAQGGLARFHLRTLPYHSYSSAGAGGSYRAEALGAGNAAHRHCVLLTSGYQALSHTESLRKCQRSI